MTSQSSLSESVPIAMQSLLAVLQQPEFLLPSTNKSSINNDSTGVGNDGMIVNISSNSNASPAINIMELMQTRAVQQLKSMSGTTYSHNKSSNISPAAVFQIVKAMCSANFVQFRECVSAAEGSAVMQAIYSDENKDHSNDMNYEEIFDKMRLIALASLPRNISAIQKGSEAEMSKSGDDITDEIPYDVIATSLGIESDQVEHWIVKAIGMRLLDAKINQLDNTVSVSRYTHSSFEEEEWRLLQSKLKHWQMGVNASVVVMDKSDTDSTLMTAMQKKKVVKEVVAVPAFGAPPSGIGA